MGLIFEKRKLTKKDVLLFISILINLIISTIEYFTDLDLFWLFTVVTIAIFVLGVSIYNERKRDIKDKE
ncbi:hypothetical protein AWH48_16615 [Domibacillus aminovorans]|uniref:Uncharacterized protein n=1 Tax=Domibacillus aminovorans TaxID=29332 RepID=A0A177KZX1_9BACI|nr:hypothetical protein [Domibacillus aminovorans]OAH58624.1 hypothetical protein AWH48_16615 [Domibacillus aminovorans]